MAGYTSFFAGGNNVATKAQPISGGGNTGANGKGGYSSYFGFDVPKAPSTQQLQQIRQQQAAQAMQNQVQQKAAPQHQSLLSRVATAVGHAGKAVVRPVADIATLQGGKAAHDTAQLSTDVTGGAPNYLLKTAIANPTKELAAQVTGNKTAYNNAVTGSNETLGLGKKGTDIKGGAKKFGAESLLAGTLVAGGGEVKGAKTLLQAGKEVTAKRVAKDAAIGATGNASATVAQNPNASAKQVGENAIIGGVLGGTAPHVIKTVGDTGRVIAAKTNAKINVADNPVTNTLFGSVKQGQDDLLQAKQNALLSKASSLETPQTSSSHVAVTPHVAYEPTNPRVKTLIDSAQKQQQAVEAPMKAAQTEQDKAAASAEKAQADGQKIDRQIELLQAKAKDSETGLSNVDKTKLGHLQQDKAQVGATAPVEPVTKPVSESPNAVAPTKAETVQPAVAKESSKSSVAPENPHAGMPLHEVAKQVDVSPADRQVLQTVADQVEKQGGLKGGYYETAKRMGLGEQWQEASGNVSRASTKAYQKANPEYSGVLPGGKPAKVEAPSTKTKTNETSQTKKPVATEAPATRTLKPSETAHMPEIGGYTHSTQLAQDYADTLRGQELQAKGGQMVKNLDGSYKRISEHSPFYRAVFKETGKAPTKAQYLEQAAKELENNKDGLGAGDVYKQLLEREGKPVPRVKVESTVKNVPQGDSKVAQRIAADIKKNFGEQYKDGAKYDKIIIADQAAKAEKLVNNREELDKVISGEKPLPDGLRATSIVTAIRNTPELAKDGELLKRLASSPISSEASYSAQELRLAAENAKNDPVAAIKSIQKARQDAYKAKTGKSANAAAQSEIKQIRAATPKATVTKESWGSFIDSLKC